MNSESLDRIISEDDELSTHRPYLDSIQIPSVDISISNQPQTDHGSRFSGTPVVPKDFTWPTHETGEYRFLGQINFSEIEKCPNSLPESGLLSLFYAFDEEGEIFWGDDGYILGYYWPEVNELNLSNHQGRTLASKKIVFRTGVEIPRHEDLREDWPFDTEALWAIHESKDCSEDYMLGYPSFCTLAYDPTPGKEWISLLTLASHDEFEWCWHDGGKLMIFIENTKLHQADFSYLKTDAG